MPLFNTISVGGSEYMIEEHEHTFTNDKTKTVSFDTNLTELFMFDAREVTAKHGDRDMTSRVLSQFCGSVSIDGLCVHPFSSTKTGYTLYTSGYLNQGERRYNEYGDEIGTPTISNGKVTFPMSGDNTYVNGTWKFVLVGK